MKKSTIRIIIAVLLLIAGMLKLIMYLNRPEQIDIVAMQQHTTEHIQEAENEGAQALGEGDYQKAIESFSEKIRLDPNSSVGYYGRAIANNNLEQYQQSVDDYDQALRLDPNQENASYYLPRGIALLGLKQYQRAIEDFDNAIQLNPKDANAYYWRGRTYKELKQNARAQQDFNRAKKFRDSDDTLLLRQLQGEQLGHARGK
jgi:tetratricopeptide (TPR) repeat protein